VQTTPEDCPKGTQCWYDIPCHIQEGENPNKELKRNPPCSTAINVDVVFDKLLKVLKQPNLSYVVVYKDKFNITEKCIHHIKESKKKNDELILVDNGSKANCNFGGVKEGVICITNQKNLGCIIGRNQGMKKASGRFVLTLDNDQFINPKTIHTLMTIEGDVVGVEGWSMDGGGWAFDIKDKRGPLAYVGGGGLLVKKKIAEEINYLSEEYAPAWFSDPDFCFKAAEAGYSIACQHYSGITHLKHKTIHSQMDFDSEAAWQRSHKIFTKKWHERLYKDDGVVGGRQVSNIIMRNNPIIMFYMLSWLRHDYLVSTLQSLVQTLRLPVYFNLRMQGSEHVSKTLRKQIEQICSNFTQHKIEYTYNNQGTAGPRREMINDFLQNYPDIDYICLADDDVTFTDYSVEKAVSLLEKDKAIGGVGIPHKGWGFYLHETDTHRRLARAELKEGITYVDVLGSGHSIFRREAFRNVEVDTDYFVGAWDWDLTFQMTVSGEWKLVILNLPGMRSVNRGGGSSEYRKVRSNKDNNKKVVNKFNEKFRLGKYGRSKNIMANN
jgi:GT2 family glycosyltransferase